MKKISEVINDWFGNSKGIQAVQTTDTEKNTTALIIVAITFTTLLIIYFSTKK